MKKKKLTKTEPEEMDARYARVLANAQRTRELAERAQAKLDANARADRRIARGCRQRRPVCSPGRRRVG